MNQLVKGVLVVFLYALAAVAGVIAGLVVGGENIGVPLGILLAFVFCIAVAVVHSRISRKTAVNVEHEQMQGVTVSMVAFEGQTYTNVDDMPPQVREAYEKAMAVLSDSDQDGMPDILEGAIQVIDLRGQEAAEDRMLRLEEAKKMLEMGLITEEDYEATKAQILSEM